MLRYEYTHRQENIQMTFANYKALLYLCFRGG